MMSDIHPAHGEDPGALQPRPSPGSETSVDDILASIRRILSEEEPAPGSPHIVVPPRDADPAHEEIGRHTAAHAPLDEDVLDLDADMMIHPPAPFPAHPPAAGGATDEAPSMSEFDHAAPAITHSAEHEPVAQHSLVAPAAAAAAASSVGELVRTLASERHVGVSRGGPTIEDLVREEIRPVLKDWLDSHLPPLVERLVRAEIERVVARASF